MIICVRALYICRVGDPSRMVRQSEGRQVRHVQPFGWTVRLHPFTLSTLKEHHPGTQAWQGTTQEIPSKGQMGQHPNLEEFLDPSCNLQGYQGGCKIACNASQRGRKKSTKFMLCFVSFLLKISQRHVLSQELLMARSQLQSAESRNS